MESKKEYFLNHSPIEFQFVQNSKDFVVDEIPLYEWSGVGEHLILKIRKRNITTWEMVSIIAKIAGIDRRDIGYAGLKDKNAMTMQYISLPKKYEDKFENLDEKSISILEKHYHSNKIKLGHLKGNKFFIRLKKVNPTSASMIEGALNKIGDLGMPNFFGFQRFGMNGDNYKVGQEIIAGKSKMRDKTKRRLFINSYQSHLFNNWLSDRIKLSRVVEEFSLEELPAVFKSLNLDFEYPEVLKNQPHPFKLLMGDILLHYPYGKGFPLIKEEFEEGVSRFGKRDSVPSGILVGKRAKRVSSDSLLYEEKILEDVTIVDGERRYAWVFPENIEGKYRESDFWYELNFFLPKGSYATTLLEEIAKRDIR